MTTFVDMQDLMLSVVSNNNKLGDRVGVRVNK